MTPQHYILLVFYKLSLMTIGLKMACQGFTLEEGLSVLTILFATMV
jgi:hypothetical protein